MATYLELFDLQSSSDLRNKVAVACVKKAQALLDLSTPTIQQLRWADKALGGPDGLAIQVLRYVLAVNSASSVNQITQATDATIQTNVSAAADKLLTLESTTAP